jgi:hypothetical protein
MDSNKIIEGINIIAKYAPEGNDYYLQPGHDQIWCGGFEWVTEQKDIDRLKELGWFEAEDSRSCNC